MLRDLALIAAFVMSACACWFAMTSSAEVAAARFETAAPKPAPKAPAAPPRSPREFAI
mgnify:CR=1 FL=1